MVGKNIINPLYRGIKVLELLAENGPIGIEQIFRDTKIPRSSIFRILCTFEHLGYVRRKLIGNKSNSNAVLWELELKLLSLTRSILSRLDLKIAIRDILEKLADETRETVQLCIYNNEKALYIDAIKKSNSLIAYAEVGTELDINLCAPGMVLVAALGDEEIDNLLSEKQFPKNTIYTINNPKELKKKLKEVAQRGFAYDNQEFAIGIRCVAAPVYNYNGKVVCAINITGHVSTMSDDKIDILVKNVKSAAIAASERLGYQFKDDLKYKVKVYK
jgi:IclR family transcriptional regulator, KDG regulon repressor